MSRRMATVRYVPDFGNERVHKILIDELRDDDFNGLRMIVLSELGNILKINLREFQVSAIKYVYTKKSGNIDTYQHFVTPISLKIPKATIGCYNCWYNPPTVGSVRPAKMNKNHVAPYVKVLMSILLSERSLRMPRIFVQQSPKSILSLLRRTIVSTRNFELDRDFFTEYDCANLMMYYLEQLEEPLFLANFHPAYKRLSELEITITQLENLHSKKLLRNHQSEPILAYDWELKYAKIALRHGIQLIVHLMPSWKRGLLKSILKILQGAYFQRKHNGLTLRDLSLIFSHLFFCPRSMPQLAAINLARDMARVVVRMIKMGPEVFCAPVRLRHKIWEYSRTRGFPVLDNRKKD